MNARKLSLVAVAMVVCLGGIACRPSQPAGAERGRALYATCASCHGQAGEGRSDYEAPAIAGLPPWYIEAQLQKFRSGARGAHPDDVAGLRMRPMSRTLPNDADVAVVAAYVAGLAPVSPAATLTGDAARGRTLFETCVQCHGADAAGNRERNAPPLNRASDWYLVAQLQKFKAGVRGTNADDVTGSQMRPMALGLADEQAMRDVVAYIATLPD